MTNKITKAQMFAQIREVVADNADMVAFIDHEIELLAKKADSKKKYASKKNEADEVIKNTILEVLATFPNGATATEVMRAHEDLSAYSNQKITAMLTKLVDEHKVTREKEKKSVLFSLVKSGEEED
jgi:hypothetical protein